MRGAKLVAAEAQGPAMEDDLADAGSFAPTNGSGLQDTSAANAVEGL
jgi:hypothetical protein